MTDDGPVMERSRAQVMYSYGERNVVDIEDLGAIVEVRPWWNSYEIEDIDKERIVTEVQDRARRRLNRTTGKAWKDLTVGNVGIYQPFRGIETRLFPTVFYCGDCKKVYSSDRVKPQMLPDDGKHMACDGQLTQLAPVNVRRCDELKDPNPACGCQKDGHGHSDYRLQKTSSGSATWRFRCQANGCGESMGGTAKSCPVYNEMSGPLPTASSQIYYAQRFARANIPFVDVDPGEIPPDKQRACVLAAVYLGHQGLEDMTIEELATEEGKMGQFDEMMKSDEDPEAAKRTLEGMGISLEGRELVLQETQHITPIDAEPHGEPDEAVRQFAWSNTTYTLFTSMRPTEGHGGDQGKTQDVDYLIPTQLDDLLSQPEFRQDHSQSSRYRDQSNASHIRQGWAVDQLLLLNVLYGFSRGDLEPKKTDLNRFTHPRGKSAIPVFTDRSPSEAIVLEVDRKAIMNWPVANGILREDADDGSRRAIPDVDDERVLQEWSLTNVTTTEIENPFDDIGDEITDAVYTFLHSMSYCLLARAGEQCGLVTDTFGERIFSNVPAIVIYAATTESSSLGGMSTLSKTRFHP